MASFGQMLSDLNLMAMASLIPPDLRKLLNKCQRDEVEAWEWSFSLTNIIINGIQPFQQGTITLTQGSDQVVGVGTNWTNAMNYWWLWSGPTLTTPVIVNQVTSPTTATLSSAWGAPTTIGTGYTLQPLYYSVYPLIEVYNVKQIDFLTETSREALNRIDPSRIATGGAPSERWANAPFDFCGNFQIELWPRISSALPYIVEGKRGHTDMINDSDMPLIPSAVIESKAMMYIARSNFASNGNPRWAQLADQYMADYMRELEVARRSDNKRAVTKGIKADSAGRLFDAAIDYNHDFGGWSGTDTGF
jgi:hypothetical protein